MPAKPSVSVVVPVYNEEFLLPGCMAALKQQDYEGHYEIIVINNACTDSSPEIARLNGARVIEEPKKGYVYALRAGFAAAKGEIIACTDADTLAPSDWISRLVENLQADPKAVAASGTFRLYDCSRWFELVGNFASQFNYHLAGGNMAVWRWAYERVGGFDTLFNMGTDIELGMRLRRLGRVKIDRSLLALTSGRRFQFAFWQSLRLYFLNDVSLFLFHRPAYFHFPDIRRAYRTRSRAWASRFTGAFLALLVFVVYSEDNPKSQLFGPVFPDADTSQKVVALTFDDGPSSYTNQVLDILDQFGIKATFFVIGENVQNYPEVTQRMVSDGDAIGNHSFDHSLWVAIEPARFFSRELDRTSTTLEKVAAVRPIIFRPPHGWRNPWMIRQARREHYEVVTWDDSPSDWRLTNPDLIVQRVLKHVHPGAVILLHDGLETRSSPDRLPTLLALPRIIAALRAAGYRFVTVPELFLIQRLETPH